MNQKKQSKGFSLLEILLVITIVGILATMVLISINPSRQISQAQNLQLKSDLSKFNTGLESYFVDNRSYPLGITNEYKQICSAEVVTNCIDLSGLVPNYIDQLPSNSMGIGYQIALNPSNGQLSLKADGAGLGEFIAINPMPKTQWAKLAGMNVVVRNIETYSDDSVVTAGYFWGAESIFGSGEVNETILSNSSGNYDGFIAKYNADGTLAWAKGVGTTGEDAVYGMSAYGDGSSIVTGYFALGSIVFGQGEVNETTLTENTADYGFFIAKYNTDGTLAWAKRGSSIADRELWGERISTYVDGSSIVTGYFVTEATFGIGEVGQVTLSSGTSYQRTFVAKYNANGTLAWAQRIADNRAPQYLEITSLADGGALITGDYNNAYFAEGTVNETVILSNNFGNNKNTFIAKYNSNGSLAWVKTITATDNNWEWIAPNGISSYSDGSFVIGGGFHEKAIFGIGEANETTIYKKYNTFPGDGFIAKYNADGTLAWVKSMASDNWDGVTDVDAILGGDVAVTGEFSENPLTLGEGQFNETILKSSTGVIDNMFVAKYDSDGNLVWADTSKSTPDSGYTGSYGRRVDSFVDGSILASGDFGGRLEFDSGQINATLLRNPSGNGGYEYMTKYNK